MSEFQDLANAVTLADELAIPTEFKEAPAPPPEPVEEIASPVARPSSGNDIIDITDDGSAKATLPAEESAEVLVALIDGIQSPIFTGLHFRKFKNKFTKEQKKSIDQASLKAEVEQTDEERNLLGVYSKMEAQMKELIGAVPLTDEESNRLRKIAIPMVKKHGMDIPPALAFALVSMQIVSNRVVDLVSH